MRRLIFAVALVFAPAAAAAAAEPPPVEVMIVGGFHMANPGHDLHDTQVPDVLAPERQAEIAAVDQGLARFRPTLVAAEWSAATVADRYPKYLAGALPPSRNEVVQLGFRLAKETGARMIGVDVDGDFPFQPVKDYAQAHGEAAILDRDGASMQASVDRATRLLKGKDGIAATLRDFNDPAQIEADQDTYRNMLRIGGGTDQPGAELLTDWYKRNFLICANLIQATRPGDRVVVFYGSGHAFLLRQCVRETPGFKLVEPTDFLPR